ncbi:transmembrane protein 218 isoform X2 [Antennarius striatus]|uniref:transmembrane protein 218 isoform X2 n=1 Tax=Antennarius striatus TaxID=241820 RepID=UPI0035B1AC3F
MARTVLPIGAGIFVLAVVWIAALVVGVMLLRGSSKLGAVLVFLLALIITLVLVLFPRSSDTTSPLKEMEIVDTLFIGRYVLLGLVSVVFLVASFLLLPCHFLEPVYAKALRTH